jgi:hypothetical protein
MIMIVHVPFADLANTMALFEVSDTKNFVLGIHDGRTMFLTAETTDTESMLIDGSKGSGVKFSFHDNASLDECYAKEFGKEEFESTRYHSDEDSGLTPETVGIPPDRVIDYKYPCS